MLLVSDLRPAEACPKHYAKGPDWCRECLCSLAALVALFFPSTARTAEGVEQVKEQRTLKVGEQVQVARMAVAPDASLVATATDTIAERSRSLKIWDVRTGKVRATLPTSEVDDTLFDPQGKTLIAATGGFTGWKVRSWNVATGKEQQAYTKPAAGGDSPHFLGLAADGKLLATGKLNKTVVVWKVTAAAPLWALAHGAELTCGAFASDGAVFASGGKDQKVRLWNLRSGKLTRTLGHAGQVHHVRFSADGKKLATVSGGSWEEKGVPAEIRLWEVATGKELARIPTTTEDIHSLALDRTGRLLAWGGGSGARGEGEVILWDTVKGTALTKLTNHRHMVTAIAFTPDGKTMVTGSADGTVTLWALLKVAAPLVAAAPVAPIASPDDKQISAWIAALKAPKAIDRRVAAMNLGMQGAKAKAAVPALIEAVKDKDAGVREAAVQAFAGVGPAAITVFPLVLEKLKDQKETIKVRQAAAITLGAFGPQAKDAVPALKEALNDPQGSVRGAAAFALFRIDKSHAKEAVTVLRAVLKDKDEFVRTYAVNSLKAMRAEAKDAVPDLMEALNGGGMTGYYAREALGAIGPAAAAALVEALKDKDPKVRGAAASVLKEYYPQEAKKAGLQ